MWWFPLAFHIAVLQPLSKNYHGCSLMSVAVPIPMISTFTHVKKSCCPLLRVLGGIIVGGLPSPSHGFFIGYGIIYNAYLTQE